MSARGSLCVQDLEGSALELLPRGFNPLGTRNFGGGGGDGRKRPSPYLAGTSCLAGALRRDDRPPTHFFVKKKFSPACGDDGATHFAVCPFLHKVRAGTGKICFDFIHASIEPLLHQTMEV